MRKRGVVGRINTVERAIKTETDTRTKWKRRGQARLVHVKDINRSIPTTRRWACGDKLTAGGMETHRNNAQQQQNNQNDKHGVFQWNKRRQRQFHGWQLYAANRNRQGALQEKIFWTKHSLRPALLPDSSWSLNSKLMEKGTVSDTYSPDTGTEINLGTYRPLIPRGELIRHFP